MDVVNARLMAPIPDQAAGRGRGRGRNVAPAVNSTLGADVRVVQKAIHLPNSEVPLIINRQVLDLDEEADFDPNKHEPTEAYKNRLASIDVKGDSLYEDPYDETGGMKMPVAPAELIQRRYRSTRTCSWCFRDDGRRCQRS